MEQKTMASVRKREWEHKGVAKTAWVVAYTDGGGKRRLKTFDKKKDADTYRTKVEIEIEKGAHVAARASVKFDVLMAEYMKGMEVKRQNGKMSKQRIRTVGWMSRLYMVPSLGALLVNEISYDAVNGMAETMAAKGLTPYAVIDTLGELKRVLEFGIRRGYAAKHPVSDVMKERGTAHRTPILTFTPEQIGKIIATLEVRPPHEHKWPYARLKLWVHVAAFCGLRMGEIAALTPAAIDFDAQVIRVQKSLTVDGDIKGPKTRAGVREVPMPLHVAGLLDQWIRHFAEPNEHNLLFIRAGERTVLNAANVRKSWGRLLRSAGIDKHPARGDYHFHALRHFAASFMIENGMSIIETAHVLGHSKFDMTLQTYAHPIIKQNRQTLTMERMSAALLPAPSATRPLIEGTAG